jgi:hypothetical protein
MLKERCVWVHKFETREQAWEVIGAYIDRHHHRPHSGLNYRTPAEVARTWDDAVEDPKSKRLNRQRLRRADHSPFLSWRTEGSLSRRPDDPPIGSAVRTIKTSLQDEPSQQLGVSPD